MTSTPTRARRSTAAWPRRPPQTDAAVAATAGQIVTYEGRPAITYFFASSGGRTENVEDVWPGGTAEPWLRGVADPYDQGPLHRWKMTLGFTTVAARLRGVLKGSFQRDRGAQARLLPAHHLRLRARLARAARSISGAQLEESLGLYATWAYFGVQNGHVVRPEPDLSGSATPAPAPAETPPASPQGGLPAPGSPAPEAGGAGA